jgi:hypothetical protein
LIFTRDECEKQFSLALSRYVGYTTGAYHIVERIQGMLPEFDAKPYVIEIELIVKLQKKFDVGADYALGALTFATGLGFLSKFEQGGASARYVLTDLGKTFRAACEKNDQEFINYLFTYSVLEFDCDVYGLLLDMASGGELPSGEVLRSEFLNRTIKLREERFEWLKSNFPNHILRDRIEKNILWIKSKGPNKTDWVKPSSDFARHHASPRKGWAQSLGHLDKNGFLTCEGAKILKRIRGERDRYFWIAPPKNCFEKMKLSHEGYVGVYGPAWELLRGEKENESYNEIFVEAVTDFMIDSYPMLKLSKMNQVSLGSIIPYLHFLECKHNCWFDTKVFFGSLFSQKRDVFAPMSSRSRLLGHYQLRKRKT